MTTLTESIQELGIPAWLSVLGWQVALGPDNSAGPRVGAKKVLERTLPDVPTWLNPDYQATSLGDAFL